MSTVTKASPAEKFRKMADGMTAAIEHGRRELSQNPTPKRMREYRSRLLDADNSERGQKALNALADAWDRGDVPVILSNLRTKSEIVPLVRYGMGSNGYYDVHSTGEYADKSARAVALQMLVAASETHEDLATKKERERKQKIDRMIDELRFSDIPGFFPTPRPVIEAMLERADIRPGHSVLEPSAGIGSIVDAIRECHPSSFVQCCEIRPSLRAILYEKRCALLEIEDFLQVHDNGHPFNRIVMNPPFENGQDIEHVRHAYGLLATAGRLVAIVSNSFLFNSQRKFAEFRDWLRGVHHVRHDIEAGAFTGSGAFRQTGVACQMLAIDK